MAATAWPKHAIDDTPSLRRVFASRLPNPPALCYEEAEAKLESEGGRRLSEEAEAKHQKQM